ncbi:hypothetical protein SAMD00019534_018540 [Acytostelium subglobosum LB1]|uniref:hypothetical protein n=1 Tax=Acytostelium subglobosum LB1 TaxID=1410327 RepID=UPI000644FB37|nr:hypothetical protein SAMD00019534_018540 [Acytostelium subglobosum LB1]GAM18679.1 hypothetical protein SAMD00019534_018540 [Acytostelium subglobosum LB1]|eukprot:XP_012757899.1 hypothetical protein SAMD00019534_018540 [Acytostelium subglobosum LB1]
MPSSANPPLALMFAVTWLTRHGTSLYVELRLNSSLSGTPNIGPSLCIICFEFGGEAVAGDAPPFGDTPLPAGAPPILFQKLYIFLLLFILHQLPVFGLYMYK